MNKGNVTKVITVNLLVMLLVTSLVGACAKTGPIPAPAPAPAPVPSPVPDTPVPTPTPTIVSPTVPPLVPPSTSAGSTWTMEEIVKDWLITPHDIAVSRDQIYVSGNLDRRVAVLSLDGRLLRCYTLELKPDFDNVSVGVTSMGRVLAISSSGLWELMPDGEAKKIRTVGWNIEHMTIGPDDGIYVSRKARGMSIVSKIGTDNRVTDIAMVDSDRVSDLEFDSSGLTGA